MGFRMMPHAKSDSKMQKRESLFAVNEIAEMKNCSRCLMIEGRRKKDVYLWASVVARGPSVKFEVENIHTMAELKMTGNCLAASRPMLSFSEEFSTTGDMHWQVIKQLLTGIFDIPSPSHSSTMCSHSPLWTTRSGSEITRFSRRLEASPRSDPGWFSTQSGSSKAASQDRHCGRTPPM